MARINQITRMQTENLRFFMKTWNIIKLRKRPNYPFFILSILLGLIVFGIPGALLALAGAWTFERLAPPGLTASKGVIRDRTKGIINTYAIVVILRMLYFYLEAMQLDQMNSVGWAAGVSTEWAIGSSSGFNFSIVIFSVFISVWLFVQSSLAKRAGVGHWRGIFLFFAVSSLPFMHFIFGSLWFLNNLALIVVLIVSSFKFRLPREWPAAMPPVLPAQQATRASSIEAELIVLKRMLDSDLLSQEEFSSQKQELLDGVPNNKA